MTMQAETAGKQTTQTEQQLSASRAKLDAFLKDNPDVHEHVAALGKSLFEPDAKALKSSLGKAYAERDTYKKLSKWDPEQHGNLAELSMLQEEAIADLVEKGAPEDLLKEYAELGKKPSEIKAYAAKLRGTGGAAANSEISELKAAVERLTALVNGTVQNGQAKPPLMPTSGGMGSPQTSYRDKLKNGPMPSAAEIDRMTASFLSSS